MRIESILAPLFPRWALERARARLQFDALRNYDAAKSSRRTRGWRAGNGSADAEVAPALPVLRARSRDLVRNNPYASAGLDGLISFQVGTGIVPRSATGDKALDKLADALFAEWSTTCDLAGEGDFFQLQALAARERAEAGEVLTMLVPLTKAEMRARGTPVPLALQMLEADYLNDSITERPAAGGVIRQGVELDAVGRVVAYHLFKEHPGEQMQLGRISLESRRVPADQVLHLYRRLRAGQSRGVPDLSSVMMRLRSLDEYEDAALEQAKVQACLAAFVTSDAPAAAGPLEARDTTTGDQRKTLAPGIIERLRPGEKAEFLTPSGAGDFSAFAKHQLRAVAAGFGLTYDLLTGDLESANYSSLRAGRVAFKQRLQALQWLVMIPRWCGPAYAAFIRAAQLEGKLPDLAGTWPVKWGPPRFPLLDPQAEAAGIVSEIRSGLTTWPQAVAEFGYDPSAQIAEIAEYNKMLDLAGVILDSDPRRIAASGTAQNPKANSAIEIAANGGSATTTTASPTAP